MKKEEITELEPSESNVRDRGLIVEGLLGHYVTHADLRERTPLAFVPSDFDDT